MSCSVMHHVEVCVKDDRIVHLLTRGFGFVPFAQRLTSAASKLALRSGNSVFVIVKRNSLDRKGGTLSAEGVVIDDFGNRPKGQVKAQLENGRPMTPGMPFTQTTDGCCLNGETCGKPISRRDDDDDDEHWTAFCCENDPVHTVDSVFNVALIVKDVEAVTERVRSRGGRVLRKPVNLPDVAGDVKYSIVTSCCGNIVHTLIDKKQYSGSFLPGFETIDNHEGKFGIPSCFSSVFENSHGSSCNSIPELGSSGSLQDQVRNDKAVNRQDNGSSFPPLTTHIDHVTYVCEVGKSADLLSWYEFCFGMKRFITNREESETEGFVLRDNIGLRLKVMEYWKCAESGLASPGADLSDTSLKLVIAEPLPEVTTSHVDTFLRAHRGPGVQHIGLHTPTMVATVDFMARNGVAFRKAPPVYYDEGIKLDEIKEAGHADEVDLFKELGILLDTEADVFTENGKNHNQKSYLMQVFTSPVFDENTFFLEVIQRRGAKGFGAGNITALAKSIILHNQQQKGS